MNHNAVAMADTQARIPFYSYCDSNKTNNTPLVNFAMPDVQAYFTHAWANYCRAWRAYADSYSTGITVGIFGDNREPHAPPDIIGWEYIGGGMENIDVAELQTQPTWTAAESTFSMKLRDSLHTINNCILVGNIGDRYCMNGYYPQWCHCAWGFDGWLFEGKMDVDGLSLSEVALLKQDVELKNSWGKQVWYFPEKQLRHTRALRIRFHCLSGKISGIHGILFCYRQA